MKKLKQTTIPMDPITCSNLCLKNQETDCTAFYINKNNYCKLLNDVIIDGLFQTPKTDPNAIVVYSTKMLRPGKYTFYILLK